MILYPSLSSKLTALPLHINDYHYAKLPLYFILSLSHLYLMTLQQLVLCHA